MAARFLFLYSRAVRERYPPLNSQRSVQEFTAPANALAHVCKRLVSGRVIAARNQALSMASPEDEEKCWVCFEGEDDGPLLQPCACRGTATWVHQHCLETWRRTGTREDAAYRCGQCMDEYRDALSLELLAARFEAERTNGQPSTLTSNALALELHAQGHYDEAELLLREALKRDRTTLGNLHRSTLTSVGNLGTLLQRKGDLAAAEPLLHEALEGERETLGSQHPSTLSSTGGLGMLLRAKGDLAGAETLLREALAGKRTAPTLGNRHASTLISIYNLGSLLQAKGDLTASEPLLREALNGRSETLGDRHPHTLASIASIKNLTALSTTSKAKLRTEVKELRARLNVLRGNERRPTEPWKLAEFNELAPFFVEKKQRLRRMVAWYDLKYVVA